MRCYQYAVLHSVPLPHAIARSPSELRRFSIAGNLRPVRAIDRHQSPITRIMLNSDFGIYVSYQRVMGDTRIISTTTDAAK